MNLYGALIRDIITYERDCIESHSEGSGNITDPKYVNTGERSLDLPLGSRDCPKDEIFGCVVCPRFGSVSDSFSIDKVS